jgi:hypothetical protein
VSRPVGVAAVVFTGRVCVSRGGIRLPSVQASLGVDRRREPPRSAITSQFAASTRCPIVFRPRHGVQAFPSLSWVGAQRKRARTHARSNQIATCPPGWWDNARRSSTAPAPQSKPVTHASRLVAQVAQSVAFGLGLRILAAGPAHVRHYSDRSRYVKSELKSWPALVGASGRRLIRRASRRGRLPRSSLTGEPLSETATPADRIENWELRSPARTPNPRSST